MSKKSLQSAIWVLGVITALVHLALAFFFGSFDVIFLLNGVGYIVLLWALLKTPAFLSGLQSLIPWALILFTLVTIVLFFVFNAETGYGPLGLFTKADEILLIVAVFMYSRTE